MKHGGDGVFRPPDRLDRLPGSALGDGGEGHLRAASPLEADRYDEAADRLARLV